VWSETRLPFRLSGRQKIPKLWIWTPAISCLPNFVQKVLEPWLGDLIISEHIMGKFPMISPILPWPSISRHLFQSSMDPRSWYSSLEFDGKPWHPIRLAREEMLFAPCRRVNIYIAKPLENTPNEPTRHLFR
jgi:hypothetical protein